MQLSLVSIREQLQQSVFFCLNTEGWSDPLNLEQTEIALYRLKNNTAIGYRTAIAFQLAHQLSRSPWDLAQTIELVLRPMLPEIKLEVTLPGFIDFWISDRYLSDWLDSLIKAQHEISFPTDLPKQQTGDFFLLQYAHARSHSLLRFGDHQGLIQLNPNGNWIAPTPIPWLNANSDPVKLRLKHFAEQNLMAQLFMVVDSLYRASGEDWEKLATALSEALLEVERHCRIWGEVAQYHPKLAQARLGLIAIAHFLLRRLLQEKMGIVAPLEL